MCLGLGGSTWKRTKKATTEPSGLPQPALNGWGEQGEVKKMFFFGCSCVEPRVGLNDPYGSFPTWNILWFYDLCHWGMGHVPLGWAVAVSSCVSQMWVAVLAWPREQGDVSSQAMLLAMPYMGQATFSSLQLACLSVHPTPSTMVQTTAFSSKKCPRYHYGQMFIHWSPQEILMLNYCPVFASKYIASVSWWASSKGISIKMIPRG